MTPLIKSPTHASLSTATPPRLTALVEAQHLLTADHGTFPLLKNLYGVDLVSAGDRWLIHRLRIDNVWFTGDPTAIFNP